MSDSLLPEILLAAREHQRRLLEEGAPKRVPAGPQREPLAWTTQFARIRRAIGQNIISAGNYIGGTSTEPGAASHEHEIAPGI